MSTSKASTLTGHRAISDVAFDCGGTLSTDIGWVIFEVSDEEPEHVRGVIGTFNNYGTLKLIRFERMQKPCRICGVFEDGDSEKHTWLLDDVVFTEVLLRDVTGLIGFRAAAVNHTC